MRSCEKNGIQLAANQLLSMWASEMKIITMVLITSGYAGRYIRGLHK